MLGSRLCGYRIAEAADHVGKIDRIHRDAGSDTTGTVLTTWDIQFPADYRNAFHVDPEEPFRDLRDWFGSLIQDKADESGFIYMRNRYYDPATGKFTQEDPIGLAGGLNLYGFAGGDPINFSDPFGLCPEYLTGRPCVNPLAATGEALSLRPDGKGAFDSPRKAAAGGVRAHGAADLSAPLGTPVGAADMGTIVAIDRESKTIAGNYVIIGHPDAEGSIVSYTAYMHLGEIAPGLEAGSSRVAAGQVIGRTGDTGNAKGEPPHLHFEIRTQRRGGQLDPTQHLEIRRP